MTNKPYDQAVKYAEVYFLDNPGASVSDGARVVHAKCQHKLSTEDIARVRRLVRERINRAGGRPQMQGYSRPPQLEIAAKTPVIKPAGIKPAARTVRPAAPFNPPRIVTTIVPANNEPAEIQPAAVVELQKPKLPWGQRTAQKKEQVKLKRDFLWSYVDTNPEIAPKEMQKLVQEKFGAGLPYKDVIEAIHISRATHGLIEPKPVVLKAKRSWRQPEDPIKQEVRGAAPATANTQSDLRSLVGSLASYMRGSSLGKVVVEMDITGTVSCRVSLRDSQDVLTLTL